MVEKRRITANQRAHRIATGSPPEEPPAAAFKGAVYRQPDKLADAASGRTLLIDAILKKDEKKIAALVRSGASLSKCDKDGRSPLHHAVKMGNPEVVALLLKNGAPVNMRSKTLATPLFDALGGPQPLAMVNLLLAAGADANIPDKQDRVPLHAAAAKSSRDTVLALALATDNPARPDSAGVTALHEACRSNGIEAVQALLALRLSPFTATRDGDTALHFALQRQDSAVAFFLLTTDAARLANAVNLSGVTPLQLAAKTGKIDIARRLLALGGDPNQADKQGMSALHHAAAAGNVAETLLLIQNGADVARINPSATTTPLMQAVNGGNVEVVKALLNHGADPNQNGRSGTAPLMMAIYQRNTAIFDLLLDAGADPNVVCSLQTPLHAACNYGLSHMAERLLKAKANPNVTTSGGRTPLHMLTDSDSVVNLKLISQMLEAGADPTKRDSYGNTPYDQAYTHGRTAVTEMFRKNLAEKNTSYKPKRTSYGWDY